MHPNAALYEQDFYQWTQEQAALLEARQFDALDIPNLVEEIMSLGVSDRRALTSHLIRLVMHLLKWRYQPGAQSPSWRGSIRDARLQIHLVLDDSPSLRRQVSDLLLRYYPKARLWAQDDTGLTLTTFPETCPWTPERVLDETFWPEGESTP
jgi:hypothetical protein